MPFLTRLHGIAGPDPKVWMLARPMVYSDPRNGRMYIQLPGQVSDLASIPRFARTIIPGNGLERQPAVIHDRPYEAAGQIEIVLNPEDLPQPPADYEPWWSADPADMWKPTPVEARIFEMYERCQIQIGVATLTRAETDSLFAQAMRCARVSWAERTTMHAAVRLGGWPSWNSHANERERDPSGFDARVRMPPRVCRLAYPPLIDHVDV